MARSGASPGVGGDWDLLFGDPVDAQAKASALAQALRGQQSDALALQALTGGPKAAPQIAGTLAQNAQQELGGLGQAAGERLRQAMAERHAQIQEEQMANTLRHQQALEDVAYGRLSATDTNQQGRLGETTRHNKATEALLGGGAPGGGGLMSPAALDQAAEMYSRTGTLPPIVRGRSGAALAGQIANRAAILHPEADLSGNKAGYKADTGSLTKQQAILDNTESWERTGKANLDVLQGIAQKLTDSGSPWLNKPARAFAQGTGDPNMTAFRAAHSTVVNEYAKILSGSQGSGGVTEGARHEAEAMLPLDATVAQIAAAAKILDLDAGNRVTSLRAQLGTVKGRTAGKAPAAGAAGAPPDPAALQAVRSKYGL